jgi:hypothetical protein
MADNPEIGNLYVKFNEPYDGAPSVSEMLGALSVTSQFKLSMHLTSGGAAGSLTDYLKKAGVLDTPAEAITYDFLCSDASLPGLSFNLSQEMGNHQGVIEPFPLAKIYPPLDVTFYVDKNFKVIRLFEEWMNFINPLHLENGQPAEPRIGGMGIYNARNQFFRLRYPEDYKKIISITKFERNFRVKNTNVTRATPSVTYRLIDAFPTNVNSIPVTYEGSTITKTTVSFAYSRYVMDVNEGYEND